MPMVTHTVSPGIQPEGSVSTTRSVWSVIQPQRNIAANGTRKSRNFVSMFATAGLFVAVLFRPLLFAGVGFAPLVAAVLPAAVTVVTALLAVASGLIEPPVIPVLFTVVTVPVSFVALLPLLLGVVSALVAFALLIVVIPPVLIRFGFVEAGNTLFADNVYKPGVFGNDLLDSEIMYVVDLSAFAVHFRSF